MVGILLLFINPSKLDASDFMMIAWNPGQELLKSGSINANYPYPLWTVLVMLPFTVWPSQTAMFLWFIFNVLLLSASLAILISLFEWKVSPVLFVLVVSLSGLFLPVLSSIWLGQLTILSLFLLALTTYLFLHQRWTWLGIILGLSFIKPQVIILLVVLVLFWALRQRRWQTLLGFASVIMVLILLSLPFISSLGQIFGEGIGYHLETFIRKTSTLWGLLLSLGFPWLVPMIISLALLIWLGWIWLPFFRGTEISSDQILFRFSAAITVNLITIPYSWMHNLIILLLPLGFSLALVLKIKSRRRFGWLTLLFVFMHPLMLGLYIAFRGNQAFQIIPGLVLLPTMGLLELLPASEKL
jgi:hypothetical protein